MRLLRSLIEQQKIIRFLEPNLLFQDDQIEKINDAMEGIQRIGPYDYNTNNRNFDNVRIIIISPNKEIIINKTLKLVNYLETGVKWFNSFSEIFHLDEVLYPEEKTDLIIYEEDKEKDIIYELNELYPIKQCPRNQKYCVIAVGSDHLDVKSQTNNYYKLKKICLESGYPIQYFSNYSTRSYGGVLSKLDNLYSLQYILWNICVGIYSKIGGIPWLLKNPNEVDLTIGLRFARHTTEGGGYSTGFLSLFNKYGKYLGLYSNTYPDLEYQLSSSNFGQKRLEGMSVPSILIQQIIEETYKNYLKTHMDEIEKITIQKIGYYSNEEIKGFREVFEKLEIEKYSLVEVINDNSFRLFNLNNSNFNIDRGICFQFNEYGGFLCTTGDYNYFRARKDKFKVHEMGTPRPLLVNLKRNQNCYRDYSKTCQDLFTLTALHYQTVTHNEIRLPATLVFAQKVAKFSKYNIKPHDNLKNIPWFL